MATEPDDASASSADDTVLILAQVDDSIPVRPPAPMLMLSEDTLLPTTLSLLRMRPRLLAVPLAQTSSFSTASRRFTSSPNPTTSTTFVLS